MKNLLLVCMVVLVCLAGCGSPAATDQGASSAWSITVTSPAGTRQLTMQDLKALPQSELEYLAKETGTTNKYKGPLLKEVLKAAGVDLAAVQSVDVEAEDAFFATFSKEVALRENVVLVLQMDGGPLPKEMGTARVLAPGETTKFQVKFVKRITVK
jgi:DMSO/TMAO reductase YedYZ molybdopterin-dependent catalytic subunit